MQARPLESAHRISCAAAGLLLASVAAGVVAEGDVSETTRRQELLAGEVLFLAYQKDYASAITHLELAHERDLLPHSSTDWDVLLTRLKIDYGLHEEARLALPAQLSQEVPETTRNRTRHELATTLFHKGYPQAAMDTLDSMQGEVPQDILGDHQLLQAHVLIALRRYRDAAKVLEKWRGTESAAGYAYYNRGIALLRAGEFEDAVDSLTRAARIRGEEEDLLALKDKANLTLGYTLLRAGDLERARSHLQRVDPRSPFSSQALLTLGWIAHEQGQARDALASWIRLRNRNLVDPAVQESLLAVPFAYRELGSLKPAAEHYEQAVGALSRELRWLDEVMASMHGTPPPNILLLEQSQASTGPAYRAQSIVDDAESRYFGPVLASRVFLETSRGHSDLHSMLDSLDQGLEDIDGLANRVRSPRSSEGQPADTGQPSPKPTVDSPGAAVDQDRPGLRAPAHPGWALEWQGVERAKRPSRGIPLLPELELPPESAVIPLPQSEVRGFPESQVIGFPESDVIDLPGSEVIWLPDSELIGLPDTGRFRLPQPDNRDAPYPDAVAREEQPDGTLAGSRQVLADPGTDPDGQLSKTPEETVGPAGAADPAAVASTRLAEKVQRANLEQRLAALRERISRLRERVVDAITRHEDYAKSLAVAELERRQARVEQNLEQASLELAKTYDLAIGQ